MEFKVRLMHLHTAEPVLEGRLVQGIFLEGAAREDMLALPHPRKHLQVDPVAMAAEEMVAAALRQAFQMVLQAQQILEVVEAVHVRRMADQGHLTAAPAAPAS